MEFDFESFIQAKPTTQHTFRKIHKKQVCRYWLTNSCSKGDTCEFLHEYEDSKMPDCRKGESCADPSCILKHTNKESITLCPNYEAGFCSFGHSCQWQHVFRDQAPPQVAAQWLLCDPAKEVVRNRAQTQRSFRKGPCPYFKHDGWCPYFYTCAFKHD